MRVHHLNTGTMCPRGGRLVSGSGGLFARARLVCHCLLIESDDGLVLVDTGIGSGDIAAPARLGARWVRQAAPRLDASETALQQVRALGFSPDDVRHILLTHLDRDHAGGIGDFPKAKVHVHRAEHAMAVEGLRRRRPAAMSRANGGIVPTGSSMAMTARTGSAFAVSAPPSIAAATS
ncbi:MBL fold metallo-hydrolase [Bradyrhizobium oligotrophicum S58]